MTGTPFHAPPGSMPRPDKLRTLARQLLEGSYQLDEAIELAEELGAELSRWIDTLKSDPKRDELLDEIDRKERESQAEWDDAQATAGRDLLVPWEGDSEG
jgi:hypothetical protein